MRRMLLVASLVLAWARAAGARDLDYAEALRLARARSPDVLAAHAKEAPARASVRVAGELPNPSVTFGTYTQTAKIATDVTLPILIFGQRESSVDAAEAELAVARADTLVTTSDVLAAAAHAFVALWAAERTAEARHDAAAIAARNEDAVVARVEAGTAPELDRLRAHAERLRADADASDADAQMDAAADTLGAWLGIDGANLRTRGDADVPASAAPLASLRGRVEHNPVLDRDRLDAAAALARASREKALARPALVLGFGAAALDPTVPGIDIHGSIGFEVPILSWRQPMVDRERAAALAADAQRAADRTHLDADLAAAYRVYRAATAHADALEKGVVPAAEAAAVASREAYALGHSPLVAVLDAERSRIEAKLQLVTARADRASAWIEVQRAVGGLR